VKPPSLLQTSALRLALQYTLLYVLVLGIALAALFWSSRRYVDSQLEADIEQELSLLAQAFHSGGAEHLIEVVSGRAEEDALDEGRFYLLVTPEDRLLAGNLTKWPGEASVSFDGDVHNIWLDENILPAIAREFPDGNRLLLVRAIEQDNVLREVSEYLLESLAAVVFIALLMGVTMGRAILRRMISGVP
jgi:hypothetical protein